MRVLGTAPLTAAVGCLQPQSTEQLSIHTEMPEAHPTTHLPRALPLCQAAQLPALRSADKCDQSSMDKSNYLHGWRREMPRATHGWVTSQPRPWAAPGTHRGSEEHAALRRTALVPGAGRGKRAAEAPDESVGVPAITSQRPLLQLSR